LQDVKNINSYEINTLKVRLLACVASVSVGFGSKERDFWCFARAENGEREPKLNMGVGEGKEGNACRQNPGF